MFAGALSTTGNCCVLKNKNLDRCPSVLVRTDRAKGVYESIGFTMANDRDHDLRPRDLTRQRHQTRSSADIDEVRPQWGVSGWLRIIAACVRATPLREFLPVQYVIRGHRAGHVSELRV